MNLILALLAIVFPAVAASHSGNGNASAEASIEELTQEELDALMMIASGGR